MAADVTLAAVISGAIFGTVGYVMRTIWDSYTKYNEALRIEAWKIEVTLPEQRLSKFYWPIYLRLQRDNVVWKKILDRTESDDSRRKIAYEIEKTVIIPNHLEIMKIIQSAIHLAGLDKELESLLMSYHRHIDVYTSMRSAGIYDRDPIAFGEPWPRGSLKP
jgi:hypothetical protein